MSATTRVVVAPCLVFVGLISALLVSALLVACGNDRNMGSSMPGGNQGGGPGGSNGQATDSMTVRAA